MEKQYEVSVYGGKYNFFVDGQYNVHCQRFKCTWLVFDAGSNAVMQLVIHAQEMTTQRNKLLARLGIDVADWESAEHD